MLGIDRCDVHEKLRPDCAKPLSTTRRHRDEACAGLSDDIASVLLVVTSVRPMAAPLNAIRPVLLDGEAGEEVHCCLVQTIISMRYAPS